MAWEQGYLCNTTQFELCKLEQHYTLLARLTKKKTATSSSHMKSGHVVIRLCKFTATRHKAKVKTAASVAVAPTTQHPNKTF